jgi:hypothetical protein
MYLWLLLTLPPPEILHQTINLLTQRWQKKENTHKASGNGLNNSLEENFLSSLWEKFELLVVQSLPHLVFNTLECLKSRLAY